MKIWPLLFLVIFAGCKDKPYREEKSNPALDSLSVSEGASDAFVSTTAPEPQPIPVTVTTRPIVEESPRNRGSHSRRTSRAENREIVSEPLPVVPNADPTPPPTEIVLSEPSQLKILGHLDNVTNRPYRQESEANCCTVFIREDVRQLEPKGEPVQLNWAESPHIYRWTSRVEDVESAPVYAFRVSGNPKEVKFELGNSCVSLDNAKNVVEPKDGLYEIAFVQARSSFSMAQSNNDQINVKRCLSIWALGEDGNSVNAAIEFYWTPVAPPLSVYVNAHGYSATTSYDDLSYARMQPRNFFRRGFPVALKADVVVAHALITNTTSRTLSSGLVAKNNLALMINNGSYAIPGSSLDVRYYGYKTNGNVLGDVKPMSEGLIMLEPGESAMALFVLGKDIPLSGVKELNQLFRKRFVMETAFVKGENVVDGLFLQSRDGLYTSSYAVPWNDIQFRRRREAR